jgi:hypothetical protein
VEYVLWGTAGGLVNEGLGFVRQGSAKPGDKAEQPQRRFLLVALFVRLGVGAIVVVAAGMSGKIPSPLIALTFGYAAPTILESLTSLIPIGRHDT